MTPKWEKETPPHREKGPHKREKGSPKYKYFSRVDERLLLPPSRPTVGAHERIWLENAQDFQ